MSQPDINAIVGKVRQSFRGAIAPENRKNYILGFLFYKYLSDTWKDKLEQYREEFKGDEERVQRRMKRERYLLPEGCDFETIYAKRNDSNIGEVINLTLEKIENANKARFEGIFRYLDFNSELNLGDTKSRNARLKQLIEGFAHPLLDLRSCNPGNDQSSGHTYRRLLERFASDDGKKGDEFFTPPEVSTLLARLLQPKKGDRICDPVCGSGSLLIRVADEIEGRDFALYGQERSGGSWMLCRMNMFLHNLDGARIESGDTLRNPKLTEGNGLMKFEIVVGVPPFSDKWEADQAAVDKFNRFRRGAPPRSKADYAYITHLIETAVEGAGKVGVVVPHGALFRGGVEGKIRRSLIEENLLEAVIGLPANLFYRTGIPTAILIFNRGKKSADVLLIDASREYDKSRNQSKLRDQDLARIVGAYRKLETIEGYSHRATPEEIKANNFSLNIPRYVARGEKEGEIDVATVRREIDELENELAETRREIAKLLQVVGSER
jgi:type I restriction enzyme M protein